MAVMLRPPDFGCAKWRRTPPCAPKTGGLGGGREECEVLPALEVPVVRADAGELEHPVADGAVGLHRAHVVLEEAEDRRLHGRVREVVLAALHDERAVPLAVGPLLGR